MGTFIKARGDLGRAGAPARQMQRAMIMPENPRSPIPPEWQAELDATENEAILPLPRFYCTLHRRRIDGLVYVCHGCRAPYCTWAAREMEHAGKGCVMCNQPIENADAAPGDTRESGERRERASPGMDAGAMIGREGITCFVHKGPVFGTGYICPACNRTYCLRCAQALKEAGEKCWSCAHALDW